MIGNDLAAPKKMLLTLNEVKNDSKNNHLSTAEIPNRDAAAH